MDEETKLVINCTITSCGHVLPPTSVTFILSPGSVLQCVHNITVQYKCTLNISSGLNLRQWWEDLGYSNTSNIIEDTKYFHYKVFDKVKSIWQCMFPAMLEVSTSMEQLLVPTCVSRNTSPSTLSSINTGKNISQIARLRFRCSQSILIFSTIINRDTNQTFCAKIKYFPSSRNFLKDFIKWKIDYKLQVVLLILIFKFKESNYLNRE